MATFLIGFVVGYFAAGVVYAIHYYRKKKREFDKNNSLWPSPNLYMPVFWSLPGWLLPGMCLQDFQTLFVKYLKLNDMRVEIKTNGPVKDKDIKALYILNEGIKTSTPRMIEANLKFVAEKYGFQIIKTASP